MNKAEMEIDDKHLRQNSNIKKVKIPSTSSLYML